MLAKFLKLEELIPLSESGKGCGLFISRQEEEGEVIRHSRDTRMDME